MKRSMSILLLLLAAVGAQGQSLSPEVVSSGGDTYASPNARVDWTAGEAVIQTATGGSNQLTQGFHQTRLVVTAVNPGLQTPFAIQAFPNPAQDYVFVEAEEGFCTANVRLIDLNGKILSGPISMTAGERHEFDLRQVALGQYFIQVQAEGGTFAQTFKVIKTH